MMKCKKLVPCHDCKGKGYITLALGVDDLCGIGSKTCESCNGLGEVWEAMTNADRIRAMSDENLAKVFTDAVADGCPPRMDWDCSKDENGWDACAACWCKWLQQAAEEI